MTTPITENLDVLAAQANALHERMETAIVGAVASAIECGTTLIRAKAAVRHGSWENWVAANCKFRLRTAQGYMRLAALNEEAQRVALLQPLREALEAIREPVQRIPVKEETRTVGVRGIGYERSKTSYYGPEFYSDLKKPKTPASPSLDRFAHRSGQPDDPDYNRLMPPPTRPAGELTARLRDVIYEWRAEHGEQEIYAALCTLHQEFLDGRFRRGSA